MAIDDFLNMLIKGGPCAIIGAIDYYAFRLLNKNALGFIRRKPKEKDYEGLSDTQKEIRMKEDIIFWRETGEKHYHVSIKVLVLSLVMITIISCIAFLNI